MSTQTMDYHTICKAPLVPGGWPGQCMHCDGGCLMLAQGVPCIFCARMMDEDNIRASTLLWTLADAYAAQVWDETHP